MFQIPKPHEIYKHFKGNTYEILSVAEHSETGEELVIYKALYGEGKVYARPLAMFMEKTDREKYPEATQEYRFALQKEEACECKQSSEEEELNIDPAVLAFLEADSYERRLEILVSIEHRITDEMITTMALATDVEVPEGSVEERFSGLKNCLITLEKYECNRLR